MAMAPKRYNDFFTIKKIFQCEFPLSDFLSLPISNSVQPKKKRKEQTNKQKNYLTRITLRKAGSLLSKLVVATAEKNYSIVTFISGTHFIHLLIIIKFKTNKCPDFVF